MVQRGWLITIATSIFPPITAWEFFHFKNHFLFSMIFYFMIFYYTLSQISWGFMLFGIWLPPRKVNLQDQ